MNCRKCSGRMFIDRALSDETTFEVACVLCGTKIFVMKNTPFGKWLAKNEKALVNASE